MMLRFLTCSLAALTICGSCPGAVVVSGDLAAGTGVLTITSDIRFDVSFSGLVQGLVFDEWVSPPLTRPAQLTQLSPTSFSFQLNDGAVQSYISQFMGIVDDSFPINDLTDNDGLVLLDSGINDGVEVAVGDTFTFKAGSWAIAPTSQFNIQALGTFTGNAFLSNGSAFRISGLTPVAPAPVIPEPTVLPLLLLAIGICSIQRQRATKTG